MSVPTAEIVVVRQGICAVEHEHERRAARCDRRAEALQCLGRRGPALRGQRLERRLGQRLDPVERGSDEAQQRDRVVVAFVHRDPGERTHVARRPLREERRLAVTGRRHHQHQRERARRAQAVDQRRPRDRAGQERRHAGSSSRRPRTAAVARSGAPTSTAFAPTLRRLALRGSAGAGTLVSSIIRKFPAVELRVRRHSALPSWRTWDPLARVCEVSALCAIRGSADFSAANTVQITTICRPGYTGLSCRFTAPLRYWLRDMFCCRNRTGRGGARGFRSDRRSSQRPPVGSCASFFGDSGLSPAGEHRSTIVRGSGAPVIRVVLGEDSFLAREGIARVLDSIEDVDLVASCGDLDELRSTVERGQAGRRPNGHPNAADEHGRGYPLRRGAASTRCRKSASSSSASTRSPPTR